ncbi:M phase inducer phosphatase Cdc25 [Schizosaccharomyces japonicus yFS275]|uniref:M-phase inducer phosphatase n=1 Tax=Schizosaccharomyces japonicus (strain yFS275 / FY16936) TaxID=402676 RepID=B6K6J8_SCHJY|nr:M phase inducer phosphatase Cdc25 [Schizosaccharomyces japonicus yFS275]EEB09152.1 M phase inducer phosphatase Cdc25 [Schizosaccharomyces japonicus yFS275]
MDSPLSSVRVQPALQSPSRPHTVKEVPPSIAKTTDLNLFFPKTKKNKKSLLIDPFRKPACLPSPASSLAADLSMNMCIDKSPSLPTPRRSLFRSLSCSNDTPVPVEKHSIVDESPSDEAIVSTFLRRSRSNNFPDVEEYAEMLSPTQPMSRAASLFVPKGPKVYSKLPPTSSARTCTVEQLPYRRPIISRLPTGLSKATRPLLRSRSTSSSSIQKRRALSSHNPRQVALAIQRTCSESSTTTVESLITDDGTITPSVEADDPLDMDSDLSPCLIELPGKRGGMDSAWMDAQPEDSDMLEDLFQASPVRPHRLAHSTSLHDDCVPDSPLAPGALPYAREDANDYDDQGTPLMQRTRSMFNKSPSRLGVWNQQPLLQMTPKPYSDTPLGVSTRVEDYKLPCFSVKEDSLKRINQETLLSLLDGQYKDVFDQFVIIDCRFEYEYSGGHIGSAINLNTKQAIYDHFFTNPRKSRVVLIFHCEHSAHRAPRLALHLRNTDRQQNCHRYPYLYYPDVYILHGGYKSFFEKNKDRCQPANYVSMNDASHVMTCTKAMNNFKRNSTFLRTKSYTFGQHHTFSSVEDSPTASHSLSRRRRY